MSVKLANATQATTQTMLLRLSMLLVVTTLTYSTQSEQTHLKQQWNRCLSQTFQYQAPNNTYQEDRFCWTICPSNHTQNPTTFCTRNCEDFFRCYLKIGPEIEAVSQLGNSGCSPVLSYFFEYDDDTKILCYVVCSLQIAETKSDGGFCKRNCLDYFTCYGSLHARHLSNSTSVDTIFKTSTNTSTNSDSSVIKSSIVDTSPWYHRYWWILLSVGISCMIIITICIAVIVWCNKDRIFGRKIVNEPRDPSENTPMIRNDGNTPAEMRNGDLAVDVEQDTEVEVAAGNEEVEANNGNPAKDVCIELPVDNNGNAIQAIAGESFRDQNLSTEDEMVNRNGGDGNEVSQREQNVNLVDVIQQQCSNAETLHSQIVDLQADEEEPVMNIDISV